MRRLAVPFVALALAWLIAFPAAARAERLRIVTTFTVIADMVRNVAGEAAEVESITRPGAEIHNYQPTPGDLLRAQGADLVIWNGLGLELWFERFLANLGDVPEVELSEGIEPMSIGEGPYDGKPNPHAWMSPGNAAIYIGNIRDALSTHDPDNAAIYHANAQDYLRRVEETIAPIRERLASIPPGQRWLVTSEGAFSYLARDFGLEEAFLWPVNADAQGTPQQVRKVIDLVREHGVPAIFSESTVSDGPARQVARETGARYGGVLYVDSLSEPDGPVPTYLDLLRVTAETIAEGLTQ